MRLETLKTFSSMGVLYALTAYAFPMNAHVGFNYKRGVIGVIGFMIVEGVSHSTPDQLYHTLQLITGTALFGVLFGIAEGSRILRRVYNLTTLPFFSTVTI
ncbi:hypothetical protein E4T38_08957 [Aureobasidium subglaciale]|nr:hypothetical protein E4T38_08957 [Aureobasidium subglaciale]KAI5214606.1 hypothetical protein E4T40_08897 [Aureobasidium subglaciale]KAI5217366.1 hypothetical protein E4T41_08856 [Aureobasidium subglaciale]KAI5255048.1 hypothetical protein E4T46_08890 [Aureobasidium subglaciale]